jgi:hypothetical protein
MIEYEAEPRTVGRVGEFGTKIDTRPGEAWRFVGRSGTCEVAEEVSQRGAGTRWASKAVESSQGSAGLVMAGIGAKCERPPSPRLDGAAQAFA